MSRRGRQGVGPSSAWGDTASSSPSPKWNSAGPASPSPMGAGLDYGFGDTLPSQLRGDAVPAGGIQTVVDHGMPSVFPQNSFFFQQRRGRLDFKGLSRIDLERVVEEVRGPFRLLRLSSGAPRRLTRPAPSPPPPLHQVDIDTLQDWIENITFSELDREDMMHFTDDHFLKLFKLAQLTIEYLLNVQNAMVTYANTLEADCSRVQREAAAIDEKMHSRAEEITILRRELRQRRKTIATYEAMLSSGPGAMGGVFGANPAQAAPGVPAQAHVCRICGKAFVSAKCVSLSPSYPPAPRPPPGLTPATPPVGSQVPRPAHGA